LLAAPSHAQAPRPTDARTVLNTYCVGCHNTRTRTGNLALDEADADHIGAAPDLWEKVARKLRTREMPPAGVRHPDEDTYHTLIASIEGALDAEADAKPRPGRVPVHRLNRTEYTNAIRDLLALDIDGRQLIADEPDGHGFDNAASVLTASPVLIESHPSAAARVAFPSADPPSWYTFRFRRRRCKTIAARAAAVQSRGGISIRVSFGRRDVTIGTLNASYIDDRHGRASSDRPPPGQALLNDSPSAECRGDAESRLAFSGKLPAGGRHGLQRAASGRRGAAAQHVELEGLQRRARGSRGRTRLGEPAVDSLVVAAHASKRTISELPSIFGGPPAGRGACARGSVRARAPIAVPRPAPRCRRC
jgi:hypothetical protein